MGVLDIAAAGVAAVGTESLNHEFAAGESAGWVLIAAAVGWEQLTVMVHKHSDWGRMGLQDIAAAAGVAAVKALVVIDSCFCGYQLIPSSFLLSKKSRMLLEPSAILIIVASLNCCFRNL